MQSSCTLCLSAKELQSPHICSPSYYNKLHHQKKIRSLEKKIFDLFEMAFEFL